MEKKIIQLKKGIFITLEGPEGSGKSTFLNNVSVLFKNKKIPFILTREPGGTPFGEKIRDVILHTEIDPWTEIFLYEAARSQHVIDIIRPALKQNKVVFCDRFTDSSLAYQAYAKGLPWKAVKNLNNLATHKLKPDLTVFLDIDPKEGLQRATDHNKFEKEGLPFHQKVRKGFKKARKERPKKWLTLHSDKATPQELCDSFFKAFERRFFS